ncbi:hypothetical protein AB6G46_23970 [Providencia hangzhouensis]|uniref:hypothetical protein n=1 Tax=Providencia hangzhouensis TaxID=3031799 RepID=UPI0034DD77EB
MKFKAVFVVLALLGLVGCKPTDEDIANSTKEQINRSLKDPTSSLFRDVVVYRDGDDTAYVCGDVNAKNEYNAYTGFKPFSSKVVIGDGKLTPIVGYEDNATLATIICETKDIEKSKDILKEREKNAAVKAKNVEFQKVLEDELEQAEIVKKALLSKISRKDYEYIVEQSESLIKLTHSLDNTTPDFINVAYAKVPNSNVDAIVVYSSYLNNDNQEEQNILTLLPKSGGFKIAGQYGSKEESQTDLAKIGEQVKKISVVIDNWSFKSDYKRD